MFVKVFSRFHPPRGFRDGGGSAILSADQMLRRGFPQPACLSQLFDTIGAALLHRPSVPVTRGAVF